MERRGCSGKSNTSRTSTVMTPKKEPVKVAPKEEQDVQPNVVPSTVTAVGTPKSGEKVNVEVKKEPVKVVEFKLRLHCKSCEKAVRKSLLNITGVKCVEIDKKSGKITVLGYVNRKDVAKAIQKTGRKAEAWRPPPPLPEPTPTTPTPREDYFSPRLPKGFRCIIIPRCGVKKFKN